MYLHFFLNELYVTVCFLLQELMIDTATILVSDLKATNGFIHIINTVIILYAFCLTPIQQAVMHGVIWNLPIIASFWWFVLHWLWDCIGWAGLWSSWPWVSLDDPVTSLLVYICSVFNSHTSTLSVLYWLVYITYNKYIGFRLLLLYILRRSPVHSALQGIPQIFDKV